MDWFASLDPHTSMVRLGASIRELADETYESILGYQGTGNETVDALEGKGGHKPPRSDIQKYKDVADLMRNSMRELGELRGDIDGEDAIEQARKEWDQNYALNDKEHKAVQIYQYLMKQSDMRGDPQACFNYAARMLDQVFRPDGSEVIAPLDQQMRVPMPDEPTPEAKKGLGQALKKYERQNFGYLYNAIEKSLEDAYRQGPLESHKLWPRMVGWVKDAFQHWLIDGQAPNNVNWAVSVPRGLRAQIDHIVDITTEGGRILDQLRRENRLPQGFDVNRVDFKDFENWLMDWKRENLGSENAGEVVYQFHDGWTIQKLTTPEQLQFEGDEMGHCVGGYAHSVESGEIMIYSLRDPKGMPHVTMEIEGAGAYVPVIDKPIKDINSEDEARQYGEQIMNVPRGGVFPHLETPEDYEHYYQLRREGRNDLIDDLYPDYAHKQVSVSLESDDPRQTSYWTPSGGGRKWDNTFQVVQVQGNSNQTPKPEYQRKIREFLDYLRSKGWKFERSENWFHNFDDPRQDEYGEGAPDDAASLDEWYDNHYKTHHKEYRGVENTDAYGMPGERATVGVRDWTELFRSCLGALVDDYDQGRWRTRRWDELAQAVYHAWMVDVYKDHLTPDALEKHKENLHDEIQKAEEELNEWEMQTEDYSWDYIKELRLENFETLAKEKGLYDAIYDKADALFEEDPYKVGDLDAEIAKIAETEHEDLWLQAEEMARDEVQDNYSGNARRFLNYLYMLAESNGAVNPSDLPDPNEKNGGLPTFDELKQKNEDAWNAAQPKTPVEEGLPDTFSSADWEPAFDAPSKSFMYDPVSGEFHWADSHGQILDHVQHNLGLDPTQRGMVKGRRWGNGKIDVYTDEAPVVNPQEIAEKAQQDFQQRMAAVGPDPIDLLAWEALTPRAQQVVEANAATIYDALANKMPNWGPLNCNAACTLWRRAFRQAGVPAELVGGNYNPSYEEGVSHPGLSDHVWLVVDGKIFDPTAAQYSDLGQWSPKHYYPEGRGSSAATNDSPEWPGAKYRESTATTDPYEIHPIDNEHNVWFDTDGNLRQRFRPGWKRNVETGKMEQTGELEDTFLDNRGRQGKGWVAYHQGEPVGSLTYVDQDGWHMIGTTFVHPDHREKGLFNRMAEPLRATGNPIDAYVWENPWLKQKVRSWKVGSTHRVMAKWEPRSTEPIPYEEAFN